MFCLKTVKAHTWVNAEILLKRLLSNRRLRSTVTSSSTTRPEKTDHGRNRSGAQRASARLQSLGKSGRAGRDRTNSSSAANEISVDFEQSKEAYRSKDSLELLRSLVVFKLCSYDFLVDKNEEIMDLGKTILGQKVFDQLMKMTFYGQFVAGEDHISIKPLIQKNQAFGVGSVLDYSVEEDISQKEENQKESSSVSAEGKGSLGEGYREKNYEAGKQLGDSQREVIGTCTYFYADEAKCDQHMETFMKCIKASGGSSIDGFSAIKMTALGRPQLLLRFSEVLVKWQRFFTFLASQQDGMEASEQRLELTQLQELMIKLGAEGDFHGWFTRKKGESAGCIDILDWNSLIDDRANTSDLLLAPNVKLDKLEPLLKNFTIEDENQIKRTLERLDVLAKCALENGVRLMVDAEQTYFQPAISKLTLDSQRIYNREKPVVFNTYQCYLKEAYKNVTMDVELSRREGWCFAAKLVRGAYMYQERERAKEFRYEDPINPNYESTSTMYHRCLDFVLDEIALNRKANVMVASHNEDTIKYTLKRMNELGLLPAENKVFFGQLLGMCDQISFPLGQAGFPVYKYVPYGPVSEVMPYLSRRAQENRGFMKGAQKERELLWKELKRRLVSGELLYRPVY
ncbi:proline dehydrogenase 1, mitochondrial [Poecilia latipinna]|uniref:Proline dehydrogenase n=3 Tax=Poecilia TaxID=8080 RepID=A0A087YCW1_POEFO|nr:PREDICTED: proline dehydrogenase 1, mitochondrial-like [Poecilia formosa]XP_014841185.1 PREDICTED: proline dehydrogenase 1, mitochondrial-like [Poecilia mexicana]XP_014884321.1 PREDICTED: proline dehydrogenase 1, mitochondrial-like [Poecilia latipinna]